MTSPDVFGRCFGGEDGVAEGLRWLLPNNHFGIIYCQRREEGRYTCRFLSIWTSGRGVVVLVGVWFVEEGVICGD
jgi:hypothetical protein